MALNLRDIEVFRPYPDELPISLLERESLSEADIDRWLSAETLRVAKLGTQVWGAYAMDRLDATHFHLHGVIVDTARRKQGLGRWMVGHAIGVAESKGGRHLQSNGRAQLYRRLGFSERNGVHVFDMIQE